MNAPQLSPQSGLDEPLRLAELAAGPFVPLAEALPAMLWLGDSEGGCVYLNRALREFWGVSASDLPTFNWASTLLTEDAAGLYGEYSAAMAAQRPFIVRARYRRADGEVRVLETRGEPRFAPNGAFLGMVGINLDVTDSAAGF